MHICGAKLVLWPSVRFAHLLGLDRDAETESQQRVARHAVHLILKLYDDSNFKMDAIFDPGDLETLPNDYFLEFSEELAELREVTVACADTNAALLRFLG